MPEVISFDRANGLQRFMRRFAASGPGSWLFAQVLHHIDRPINRLTHGRHTLASLLAGIPVILLTTTGVKPRTVPLLGIPFDSSVAIIASNFGQEHHPAWYHNLRAHADAELEVNGVRQLVRAVPVDGERRAQIWQAGLRIYPGFSQYERRASHRNISVFVLEPR